jgi:outer membrane murein-binding lipoprotein Lpp
MSLIGSQKVREIIPAFALSAPRIFRDAAKLLFSLSLASILLAGCVLQPDNPLTEPEKFAEIYTTLQILAAQDSTVAARVDSILQRRGYNRAQFDAAVQYYNAHAEDWARVVQHSVSRLDSLAREEARQDSLRIKNGGEHEP